MSLSFSQAAGGEVGVCSACGLSFTLSTATKNPKVMQSRARQREILRRMFDQHVCRQGKRGRVTGAGVKVRQGRPRGYERELSAKAAWNCEQAIEARCRCRCRGRLHGRKLPVEQIGENDPHAPARNYCPGDCNCRWHHAQLGEAEGQAAALHGWAKRHGQIEFLMKPRD